MLHYTSAFTHSFTDQLIRLVHQFNQDESLWRSLEGRRRLRRKLLPLNREQHHELDIVEYVHAKPPEDCIARRL